MILLCHILLIIAPTVPLIKKCDDSGSPVIRPVGKRMSHPAVSLLLLEKRGLMGIVHVEEANWNTKM